MDEDSLAVLVYRLLGDWLTAALVVGVDSYSARTGSEPNCNAPNCRFSPEISAEPGISTASAGILDVNDAFFFCCFSFCCAGWGLEDWLSEEPGDIWGTGLVLLGSGEEGGAGTVVEAVTTGCFSCMNTSIMVEVDVKA